MKKTYFLCKNHMRTITLLAACIVLPTVGMFAMDYDLQRAIEASELSYAIEESKRTYEKEKQLRKAIDLSLQGVSAPVKKTVPAQKPQPKKSPIRKKPVNLSDFQRERNYDEALKEAIARSKDPAHQARVARKLVPQTFNLPNVAVTAPCLAWELCMQEQVDLAALQVGETYDCRSDKRFLIRKLSDNAIAIQVPALEQKGAQCGLHALVNAAYFCAARTMRQLAQDLTSDAAKQEVENYAGILEVLRGRRLDWVIDNKLNPYEYARYVGTSNDVSYEEMLGLNGNRVCANVNGIRRTIFKATTDVSELMEQPATGGASARFMTGIMTNRLPKPEVFICHTGAGHWIALRIERMPNGMTAILVDDSISLYQDEVIDKLVLYEDRLKPLASIFA